jgi:hypothetical protein
MIDGRQERIQRYGSVRAMLTLATVLAGAMRCVVNTQRRATGTQNMKQMKRRLFKLRNFVASYLNEAFGN